MRDYSDETWQSFLRSVNPATVEGERYGIPGPEERPWSAGDRLMREEHEQKKRLAREPSEPHGVLSALAIAEAVNEWAGYRPPKQYAPRKRTPSTPVRISDDRALQIAVQAAQMRKRSA